MGPFCGFIWLPFVRAKWLLYHCSRTKIFTKVQCRRYLNTIASKRWLLLLSIAFSPDDNAINFAQSKRVLTYVLSHYKQIKLSNHFNLTHAYPLKHNFWAQIYLPLEAAFTLAYILSQQVQTTVAWANRPENNICFSVIQVAKARTWPSVSDNFANVNDTQLPVKQEVDAAEFPWLPWPATKSWDPWRSASCIVRDTCTLNNGATWPCIFPAKSSVSKDEKCVQFRWTGGSLCLGLCLTIHVVKFEKKGLAITEKAHMWNRYFQGVFNAQFT